jgi:uncharacterized protein YjiS (DUF1127 family)
MRNWIAALALSDHMLRDIGLRRDEIALIGTPLAARGP